MSNFIEKCISGEVLEEEIDDFVEKWHEDESLNVELHEYLGMNWEDYSIWATNPSVLRFIIAANKRGTTLSQELDDQRYALAARAGNPLETERITKWLKKIGKI